jgi:hypothetical protein
MKNDFGRRKRQNAVVFRCVDCKLIIGSEAGESPRTQIQWDLCARCAAKRIGVVGARGPNELGIY